MRDLSSPDSSFKTSFSLGPQIDYSVFHYEPPSDSSGSDNGKTSLDSVEITDNKEKEAAQEVDGSVPSQDGDVCDSGHSGSPVHLELDRAVLEQLGREFGKIDCEPDMSSVVVELRSDTAYRLYRDIQHSLAGQIDATRRRQLLQDEELAKRLQQDELATKSPRRSRGKVDLPSTRPQRMDRPTPVVGFSVKGNLPKNEVLKRNPTPVHSLTDIMNEEQKIQQQELNFEEMLRMNDGEAMVATRLKLEKLFSFFPDIDRDFLENVFKIHCFNLSETVDSIKHSRGEHVALPSGHPQGDWDSEQRLIERTKRQSMQDMLDAYIYHPVASKDYQDGLAPEYEDYRGEASLHHRLRHECFQKAQEAHRRGLKQVAAFYSQQGHQHTSKIKEANMRASEHILAERRELLDEHNTLDLHGLHIDEALVALERIITQKLSERRKHLIVITGRGAHSRGGVARLRPAVLQYLKKQQYSYSEEQTGVLKVSLKNAA